MPIDHRAAIAAEVRAEMSRQRKTQDDLAAVLGVTQQSVSPRVRGLQSFRAEELKAVAEWLNVPVSQFMDAVRRADVVVVEQAS